MRAWSVNQYDKFCKMGTNNSPAFLSIPFSVEERAGFWKLTKQHWICVPSFADDSLFIQTQRVFPNQLINSWSPSSAECCSDGSPGSGVPFYLLITDIFVSQSFMTFLVLCNCLCTSWLLGWISLDPKRCLVCFKPLYFANLPQGLSLCS